MIVEALELLEELHELDFLIRKDQMTYDYKLSEEIEKKLNKAKINDLGYAVNLLDDDSKSGGTTNSEVTPRRTYFKKKTSDSY